MSTQPISASTEQMMIVFENVSLSFEGRQVLEDISFTLRRGDTLALLGVAGSGKTVLLKLALGLIKPDSGKIYVLGYEVTQMPEVELFKLRRKLGMVFQESALFDSLTVRENVGYRLYEEHVPESEIGERVREALKFVELEHTIDMFPSELSGGMRRRVALARALITQPEILLYDSPTGGLDPVTSTTIVELLVKQSDVNHTSALLVSHRLQDAFIMATHVFDTAQNKMVPVNGSKQKTNVSFLVLRNAKVIFEGTAKELVNSGDEYLREYLSQ